MNGEDASDARAMFPLAFAPAAPGRDATVGAAVEGYRSDPTVSSLLEFFEKKGLDTLKEEDRNETWYEDWLAFQAQQGIYASLLTPGKYSARGGRFDLPRYARFLEVFAYCSPAHGYSLQVTFLGLCSILLGANEALKREAVGALKEGRLLAFGISEKKHGSDLLSTEFSITETPGGFIANGCKYYIGNANSAALIVVLGHKHSASADARTNRLPLMLMALRPGAPGFRNVKKIRTLGVRAAFVGAFEVKDHAFGAADVIAEGRDAWDAIFGTVTLGKFFLGFGSVGICEHAFHEALRHLQTRILYGKPVLDMPHIREAMVEAFARLTAMKLYAYRALDYVQAASASDRRYLLFCAVQKAKVSTQGVKVMALLSECVGAKGFEGDTFLEMALRDAQLIPGLEGSMHINLGLTTQFMPRYFHRFDKSLVNPPAADSTPRENPYLFQARTASTRAIAFRPFLECYRPLAGIPNAVTFARQAAVFRLAAKGVKPSELSDSQTDMAMGHCMACIVYGQLVAENAVLHHIPAEIISAIFGFLVEDLSQGALRLAALPQFTAENRALAQRMIRAPRLRRQDSDFIAGCWPKA